MFDWARSAGLPMLGGHDFMSIIVMRRFGRISGQPVRQRGIRMKNMLLMPLRLPRQTRIKPLSSFPDLPNFAKNTVPKSCISMKRAITF